MALTLDTNEEITIDGKRSNNFNFPSKRKPGYSIKNTNLSFWRVTGDGLGVISMQAMEMDAVTQEQ